MIRRVIERAAAGAMAAAWLGACAPKISLQVLEPAAVNVPQSIRTVGVLDRSRPSNVGQGLLGVIEGALTGEAIGADTDGRANAVQSLVTTLRTSPRYDEVVPIVADASESGSSLFDKDLPWPLAQRLARSAGVDAIVALEAFDSDSLLDTDKETYTEEVDGKKVQRTRWTAKRSTDVLASWRMYEPGEKRVVDVYRESRTAQTWEEDGATREQAVESLPNLHDTVIVVAGLAGDAYARRIGPAYTTVLRSYYTKGHASLKAAKPHVRAGDWEGAMALWRQVEALPDAGARGRARYNLALALEVRGDLPGAVEMARLAAVDLDNGRARDYLATLEQRVADARRLESQLGD